MKDILLDQVRRGATIFLTSRVPINHEGKIVTEGELKDLRAGSETLEDLFVQMVGAEREFERLHWL
jgi:ABC-2 type transport system ATP-binding protein